MNRTAKSLARKVANGTATTAERRGFMEAAGLLGWVGARGLGVVNHTEGTRVHSWKGLAAILLEEAEETAANGAESAALTLAHSSVLQAVQMVAARVPVAEAAPEDEEPVTVVMYRTQTPTIQLSKGTAVDAVISEEIIGVTEGLCQSWASLECSLADPSMGLLRTLPESMLPGQERTIMFQCLPCYEASADAYVRKLHRA